MRKFIGARALAAHHSVLEATGNSAILRPYLLHHKQREAHESEIFHDDAPADEPQARWREPLQKRVDLEQQVEDTVQHEKSTPQPRRAM